MWASVFEVQYQSRSWPPGSPALSDVLAQGHLVVGRLVAAGDGAELAAQRQLPAHVGLGLHEAASLVEGEQVQGAPGAGREAGSVEEDAGAVDDPGLAGGLLTLGHGVGTLELDPAALLGRLLVLPLLGAQLADGLADPLLVVGVGEVRAEGAAAVVGPVGVDALAAAAEDAGPVGGEPGEVAAVDRVAVSRVGELHEGTRERQLHLGHARSLRGTDR